MSRSELASKLVKLLGEDKVLMDEAVIRLYAREPVGFESSALAVVFPETPNDVSKLLSFAYKNDVKVYPQGATTCLTGSTLPDSTGVIISMERMNKIKEVNVTDSVVIAEAGVRLGEINLELAKYGYMFPVDPASVEVATVGGAINSGAGGMRGAKYGTMRDWVLGLQIVLPDERGSILRIGCRTVKCRQGYDLVRLIVGSEGTLAIVTEATLRITPIPENVVTMLAFYSRLEDLASTVVEIKGSGVQPYIMEFMDAETVSLAVKAVDTPIKAHDHMLLVSVDVNREATDRVLSWLTDTARKHGAIRIYTAKTLEEAESKGLFSIRRSLYAAQLSLVRQFIGKSQAKIVLFAEDIAVPPSKLVEAVTMLRELEKKYKIPLFIGGHIGDGNLHPAIGFEAGNKEQQKLAEEWYLDVMKIALKLGGTVSAEHGIGLLKKEGLRMELEHLGSLKALELMKGIKKVFDPKNILNPGKIV